MILYTTHCPKCKMLQRQLDASKKEYTIVDDMGKIRELGLTSAPVLEVEGKRYEFSEALEYILKNK